MDMQKYTVKVFTIIIKLLNKNLSEETALTSLSHILKHLNIEQKSSICSQIFNPEDAMCTIEDLDLSIIKLWNISEISGRDQMNESNYLHDINTLIRYMFSSIGEEQRSISLLMFCILCDAPLSIIRFLVIDCKVNLTQKLCWDWKTWCEWEDEKGTSLSLIDVLRMRCGLPINCLNTNTVNNNVASNMANLLERHSSISSPYPVPYHNQHNHNRQINLLSSNSNSSTTSNCNGIIGNVQQVTPLWVACVLGRLPIVKLLCEACPYSTNHEFYNTRSLTTGSTALRSACFLTRIPVVQYLLGLNNSNNEYESSFVDPTLENYAGGTALINSIQSLELCQALVNAYKNILDQKSCNLLESKELIHKFINHSDVQGKTALHYAVQEDRAEAVKFLLCNRADPFLKNRFGNDVWETCGIYGSEQTLLELVKFDEEKNSISNKVKKFKNIYLKNDGNIMDAFVEFEATNMACVKAYYLMGATILEERDDILLACKYWEQGLTLRRQLINEVYKCLGVNITPIDNDIDNIIHYLNVHGLESYDAHPFINDLKDFLADTCYLSCEFFAQSHLSEFTIKYPVMIHFQNLFLTVRLLGPMHEITLLRCLRLAYKLFWYGINISTPIRNNTTENETFTVENMESNSQIELVNHYAAWYITKALILFKFSINLKIYANAPCTNACNNIFDDQICHFLATFVNALFEFEVGRLRGTIPSSCIKISFMTTIIEQSLHICTLVMENILGPMIFYFAGTDNCENSYGNGEIKSCSRYSGPVYYKHAQLLHKVITHCLEVLYICHSVLDDYGLLNDNNNNDIISTINIYCTHQQSFIDTVRKLFSITAIGNLVMPKENTGNIPPLNDTIWHLVLRWCRISHWFSLPVCNSDSDIYESNNFYNLCVNTNMHLCLKYQRYLKKPTRFLAYFLNIFFGQYASHDIYFMNSYNVSAIQELITCKNCVFKHSSIKNFEQGIANTEFYHVINIPSDELRNLTLTYSISLFRNIVNISGIDIMYGGMRTYMDNFSLKINSISRKMRYIDVLTWFFTQIQNNDTLNNTHCDIMYKIPSLKFLSILCLCCDSKYLNHNALLLLYMQRQCPKNLKILYNYIY